MVVGTVLPPRRTRRTTEVNSYVPHSRFRLPSTPRCRRRHITIITSVVAVVIISKIHPCHYRCHHRRRCRRHHHHHRLRRHHRPALSLSPSPSSLSQLSSSSPTSSMWLTNLVPSNNSTSRSMIKRCNAVNVSALRRSRPSKMTKSPLMAALTTGEGSLAKTKKVTTTKTNKKKSRATSMFCRTVDCLPTGVACRVGRSSLQQITCRHIFK